MKEALVYLAIAVSCFAQSGAKRIWNDRDLSDWATPVAGLNVRPGHYSEKEYYSTPVGEFVRTHPVYFPGREPAGVALQSTGVYWMPVFEILEQQGLEVFLVNAQHTRNVPGRKSDAQECQWLLKLHAFGLLNNSFQPTDEIRIARSLWRHRGNLVAEAGSVIQRMQKVLTQ